MKYTTTECDFVNAQYQIDASTKYYFWHLKQFHENKKRINKLKKKQTHKYTHSKMEEAMWKGFYEKMQEIKMKPPTGIDAE